MVSKQTRNIFTILALVIVTILVSFFVALFVFGSNDEYYDSDEYPEGFSYNLVNGTWTPELVMTYNDSEPIEFLEYSPFKGVVINGEYIVIKRLVIVVIPEWMESRGSFGNYTYTETWDDKNVLIGNSTKSFQKEQRVAYVFTDMNVSNDLYDRYAEYYHPAITIDMTEVIVIDLSEELIGGLTTMNKTRRRN